MESNEKKLEWAEAIAAHLCESWGWQPGEPEAIQLGINIAYNLDILVANTRTSPEALVQGLLPLGAIKKETRDTYVLTN